jgi:uncharacterized protein DUF222
VNSGDTVFIFFLTSPPRGWRRSGGARSLPRQGPACATRGATGIDPTMSWRVGLDPAAARERVRVARALATLPRLAEALARGELSYAKVRALTRVATPETEERLLAVGRAGTAAHVERIVRGWRRVDRAAEAREAARQHARRGLQVFEDGDGMVVVRRRLAPEVGALLRRALEAGREVLYQRARRETPTVGAGPTVESPARAQQQADALALVAKSALHQGLDPGTPGERYQVVIHVDVPVLEDPAQPGQSVLEDGARVSAETSRRLACDASRVVLRHDDGGRVVEIGARTRTIPPALRRALQQRDRGSGRPHDALQSGPALSAASSCRPRGGLPGRATVGRWAALPESGWPGAAGGASPAGDPRGSRWSAQGGPRRAEDPDRRPDRTPELVGGAPGPGLGDRRVASPGPASTTRSVPHVTGALARPPIMTTILNGYGARDAIALWRRPGSHRRVHPDALQPGRLM